MSICGPLKSSLLHLHTNSSHLLFYPLLPTFHLPPCPFHATLGYVLQCYANIWSRVSPFRIFPLNCYIFKVIECLKYLSSLGACWNPPLKHHIDFPVHPLSLLVNLSTFSCFPVQGPSYLPEGQNALLCLAKFLYWFCFFLFVVYLLF